MLFLYKFSGNLHLFKVFIVLHGVVFLQILMVARVMKFCRCFRLSLFRDGRVVSVLVFSVSAPAANLITCAFPFVVACFLD